MEGVRYRILRSPALVRGIAACAVIPLADSESQRFWVLERGCNVCVWMFFGRREDLTSAIIENAATAIQAIGGVVEGGTKQSLIFRFRFRPASRGLRPQWSNLS